MLYPEVLQAAACCAASRSCCSIEQSRNPATAQGARRPPYRKLFSARTADQPERLSEVSQNDRHHSCRFASTSSTNVSSCFAPFARLRVPMTDPASLPRQTKAQFYEHVLETMQHLLAPASPPDETSNLTTTGSNAASLLYGSFENFESVWGREAGRRVNWAGETHILGRHSPSRITQADLGVLLLGFYFHPALLTRTSTTPLDSLPTKLILGPFHGRPACNSVSLRQGVRPVGVCAASFLSRETVVVPNVEERPGHIACDGVTLSEIVCPVIVKGQCVGVLDVDCEALEAFGEEDRIGLERLVAEFVKLVDWGF